MRAYSSTHLSLPSPRSPTFFSDRKAICTQCTTTDDPDEQHPPSSARTRYLLRSPRERVGAVRSENQAHAFRRASGNACLLFSTRVFFSAKKYLLPLRARGGAL